MIKNLLSCCLFVLALSSSYDTRVSKQLIYMSVIAFQNVTSINDWSCSHCKKFPLVDVKAFTNNTLQMQGFGGYSQADNAIIISFRGSDNTDNWIDDFDFGFMPYAKCVGCLIHNGFYFGYMTLAAQIRQYTQLLLAKYRGASVWVTGHSLGGALAPIAALDIKSVFNPTMKVYTFGQPRIGNPLLASHFSKQFPDAFRVIHYADIVPHLPPLDFGFRHSDQQIWYTADMQHYQKCEAQDRKCSDSFPLDKAKMGDHSFNIYITLPVETTLRMHRQD